MRKKKLKITLADLQFFNIFARDNKLEFKFWVRDVYLNSMYFKNFGSLIGPHFDWNCLSGYNCTDIAEEEIPFEIIDVVVCLINATLKNVELVYDSKVEKVG